MQDNFLADSMWTPKLDPRLPKALAIKRALRRAIECGELRANDRLPPQRRLAFALGVNLSTVTRAIGEATREGLVSGETGRGTFIMPATDAARLFAESLAQRDLIDMSAIVPPAIDEAAIAATMRRVIDEERQLCLYPTPPHLHHAREAAREWLAWRGLDRPARMVALTAGAHAALHRVIATLAAGRIILTEEFTFPGVKAVARLTGARLHGVACDSEGLIPDALEQACRATSATILVTTPNMQNPTAAVMGPARRRDIAQVIHRRGVTLIEDDVYGSYTETPPLARDLDGDHIVISSLSKCVSPALRFGFVTGGHAVVKDLEQDVATTSWLCSPVMLLTAARLILTSEAMRMADAQKQLIGDRWRIVRRFFPDAPISAATHLWLRVHDPDRFTTKAREQGIAVVAGSHFRASRRDAGFVRCSITSVADDSRLAEGLGMLSAMGASCTHAENAPRS